MSNSFGWTPEQIGELTPVQAIAYSRRGKKKKGTPIRDDRDGIEISRRANLRLMAEARSLIGG